MKKNIALCIVFFLGLVLTYGAQSQTVASAPATTIPKTEKNIVKKAKATATKTKTTTHKTHKKHRKHHKKHMKN